MKVCDPGASSKPLSRSRSRYCNRPLPRAKGIAQVTRDAEGVWKSVNPPHAGTAKTDALGYAVLFEAVKGAPSGNLR